MARDFARGFYNSQKWRSTQRAYMLSKNYICERCGKVASIVHHKTYISPQNISDPNITLNWDNLEALCTTCHQNEHFINGKVTAPGLSFDEEGNLIKLK